MFWVANFGANITDSHVYIGQSIGIWIPGIIIVPISVPKLLQLEISHIISLSPSTIGSWKYDPCEGTVSYFVCRIVDK